ncbi:hypothetical protein HDU87_006260 [Geranomyces variabilis]|uniref:Uncharacterized protein n=1 Tax=Geranomyces variabilis TaxID=109894 RepID=A0AAD5TH33_9FUNG|nr:hypothetical protein HDU87_006260 [Geranomyces variabilis]
MVIPALVQEHMPPPSPRAKIAAQAVEAWVEDARAEVQAEQEAISTHLDVTQSIATLKLQIIALEEVNAKSQAVLTPAFKHIAKFANELKTLTCVCGKTTTATGIRFADELSLFRHLWQSTNRVHSEACETLKSALKEWAGYNENNWPAGIFVPVARPVRPDRDSENGSTVVPVFARCILESDSESESDGIFGPF